MALTAVTIATQARAWDSRTHQLITRLAIEALPPSAVKTFFTRNRNQLEEYSIWPDTVLRQEYGDAEARRHYINLEYFGTDPFSKLDPSLATMEREFGHRRMMMAGTLPWTVEAYAEQSSSAWRAGDCNAVLRDSGLLAHYVGDASQPLHSTEHYDGYAGDRGVHHRFEGAVDHDVGAVEDAARPQVRIARLDSVWTPTIDEIRRANGLIDDVLQSDRAVRAEGSYGEYRYNRALMQRDLPMAARQVADAASNLGSIWLHEWEGAGSPAACSASLQPQAPVRHYLPGF